MSVPPGQLHKRNMHGAIMKYLGVWSATEIYKAGDVISTTDSFGKATYICVLANVNKTPPNDTYWIRNAPFGCCGDPVISVVATDAAGSETGPDAIIFTADEGPDVVVNLRWDGTATYGTDYTVVAVGGTLSMGGTVLTMSAGAGTVTLTVTPIDDAIVEGPESVILTVGDGDGYSVGIATATGTIADNDSAAVLLLYGAIGPAGGSTDTNLYTIDPLTAAATAVGDTGHFFTGLAFDPTDGTLFGVTGNAGTNQNTLFTIDPVTAVATLIGALGATLGDICFDSTGQLYGWRPPTHCLSLVDKTTGARTDRSPVTLPAGTGGNALACAADDTLYLLPHGSSGNLYTVNATTGAITDLGTMVGSGLTSFVSAASFKPSGLLYGIDDAFGSNLFTVASSMSGGVWPLTTIGVLPFSVRWDALAWGLA